MGFTFRDGTYQRRVYFGKRTIKKGECVGIVGETGSGKSTLVRTLNGLETFQSGHGHVLEELLPPVGGGE